MSFDFIGKKVIDIRPMNIQELENEGWDNGYEQAFALVFEDGTVLYPSRDYEGNGAGVFFGYNNTASFAIG